MRIKMCSYPASDWLLDWLMLFGLEKAFKFGKVYCIWEWNQVSSVLWSQLKIMRLREYLDSALPCSRSISRSVSVVIFSGSGKTLIWMRLVSGFGEGLPEPRLARSAALLPHPLPSVTLLFLLRRRRSSSLKEKLRNFRLIRWRNFEPRLPPATIIVLGTRNITPQILIKKKKLKYKICIRFIIILLCIKYVFINKNAKDIKKWTKTFSPPFFVNYCNRWNMNLLPVWMRSKTMIIDGNQSRCGLEKAGTCWWIFYHFSASGILLDLTSYDSVHCHFFLPFFIFCLKQ